MEKKRQTRASARVSAKSQPKSQKKAKVAKTRAAPLSIGHAKKTSPAQSTSRNGTPDNWRSQTKTKSKSKSVSVMKREKILRDKIKSEAALERPLERILRETVADIQDRTAFIGGTGLQREEPPASPAVSTALSANSEEVSSPRKVVTRELGVRASGPRTVASGPTIDVADAMSHSATMTLLPVALMTRQLASAFNLMLDGMQMQRQFWNMWRPPHR